MPKDGFYETDHLDVEFFTQAVKDRKASRDAGRPIFKDVEMGRFSINGDPTRTHIFKAHERYIQAPKARTLRRNAVEDDDEPQDNHISYAEHFREAYAAFKAGVVDFNAGTPLEMLPFLSKSRIAEYGARNVRSAEALIGLPDRLISESGPATRGEIELAKAWLDNASAANSVALANAEKLALELRLAEMEAKLAAVLAAGTVGPSTDDPASWTKDALHAWLRDAERPARANASHDNLVAAVNAIMAEADEPEVVEEDVD